jgi:hypothetical protein
LVIGEAKSGDTYASGAVVAYFKTGNMGAGDDGLS